MEWWDYHNLEIFKYISFKKIYVPAVKIVQIKEKFGGLRTYAYGGDDSTHRMIRDAEEKNPDGLVP